MHPLFAVCPCANRNHPLSACIRSNSEWDSTAAQWLERYVDPLEQQLGLTLQWILTLKVLQRHIQGKAWPTRPCNHNPHRDTALFPQRWLCTQRAFHAHLSLHYTLTALDYKTRKRRSCGRWWPTLSQRSQPLLLCQHSVALATLPESSLLGNVTGFLKY